MAPPKLDDLVASYKKVGEAAFLLAHDAPVLIGKGIAGALSSQKAGSGATMTAEIGPYLESLSWMDRVFEIRAPMKGAKSITLGRTSDSDVVINDFSVSRKQCSFSPAPQSGAWILADAGSTNGTVVAGKKYKAPATVLLNGGEDIIVGRLAFEFHTPSSLVNKLRAAG